MLREVFAVTFRSQGWRRSDFAVTEMTRGVSRRCSRHDERGVGLPGGRELHVSLERSLASARFRKEGTGEMGADEKFGEGLAKWGREVW
jgi:hypothetical protein